ncbi:uncharacterized protein FPRO_08755 [Fusarium proliferatum ET1]|uniref:Uncharacterized protein n=1 Tax=Fusarium proliferatum (strain ET1) TaxID=1227346 RepID=A0A1L7W4Z7_FUSPR|nr:uncharacterized protein FPRO_08755 [Fusarium proliferatum ET1]CZR47381.1 uncharacterized protein FPRO_08755 [Fusarium proliferatum ET1]
MWTYVIILLSVVSAYAAAQTPTPTSTSTFTISRPSLTTPSCWALINSLLITGVLGPPIDMSELAEEFSEWASEWTSWQVEHVSEYRIVWEACSDDPAITDLVPVGPDACSTLKAKITATFAVNEDKDENREKGEEGKDDKPEAVDDSAGSRVKGPVIVALMAGVVLIVGLW